MRREDPNSHDHRSVVVHSSERRVRERTLGATVRQHLDSRRAHRFGHESGPDEDHQPLFADDRAVELHDQDRQSVLPADAGTRTIYEATTQDGLQRTTTEVTRDTKNIMGVDTLVVHDTVTIDNEPFEDTLDWYAQDRDGNVWYFGEATKEFKDGSADTAGSFEGGVNGALPGVIMPGHPHVGDQYRQEYAKGVAEDTGEVLDLTGSGTTPLTGPVKNLLVTKDSDLLDPSAPGENKYFARGIGLILTVQTTGPPERDQATVVEKF